MAAYICIPYMLIPRLTPFPFPTPPGGLFVRTFHLSSPPSVFCPSYQRPLTRGAAYFGSFAVLMAFTAVYPKHGIRRPLYDSQHCPVSRSHSENGAVCPKQRHLAVLVHRDITTFDDENHCLIRRERNEFITKCIRQMIGFGCMCAHMS